MDKCLLNKGNSCSEKGRVGRVCAIRKLALIAFSKVLLGEEWCTCVLPFRKLTKHRQTVVSKSKDEKQKKQTRPSRRAPSPPREDPVLDIHSDVYYTQC